MCQGEKERERGGTPMEERGNDRRDDAWRNGLTKHWTFEGLIYFDFIANCFIRNFKTSRI